MFLYFERLVARARHGELTRAFTADMLTCSSLSDMVSDVGSSMPLYKAFWVAFFDVPLQKALWAACFDVIRHD